MSSRKNIARRGCFKKIVSRKKEREWGKIILGKMRSKLAGEQKKGTLFISPVQSFVEFRTGNCFEECARKKRNRCSTRFPEFSSSFTFHFVSIYMGKKRRWRKLPFRLFFVFLDDVICVCRIFLCKIGSRKHTDLTNISNRLHKTLYLI